MGVVIIVGKRLPYTPNRQIKKAMGRLFLRSRERARCLKDAGCAKCGNPKPQAHHIRGINWARIIEVIREELLTDDLEPLCKDCHDEVGE